jgi:predicted AAA+ superfamily ATPase
VSLDGPKGVGKTETALRRAASVFRLDVEADRQVVAADLDGSLAAAKPILLDEWQRLPPVWDAVRRAVDANASASSFLLTGSASPSAHIHSGAGRIVPLHMRPMTLFERGIDQPTVSLTKLLDGQRAVDGNTSIRLAGYVDEILRSGFLGIRTSTLPRVVRARLDGYLERLFDHEVVENGLSERRPAALRQWLRACDELIWFRLGCVVGVGWRL